MKIARTDSFKKDWQSLPDAARKAAAKQIAQLLIDHTHPSLRLKGIAGRKGLFSARVNDRYRISLQFEHDGAILLRRILDHDDLYETP
ncbi:MAG: hypothetical protein WCX65_09000 [bacterium]